MLIIEQKQSRLSPILNLLPCNILKVLLHNSLVNKDTINFVDVKKRGLQKMVTINVLGKTITVQSLETQDFSLTDMAKHKNPNETSLVISHWLRTRYTVEFLGTWERLNNPDFNTTEFSSIKNESGSNGFVLSQQNIGLRKQMQSVSILKLVAITVAPSLTKTSHLNSHPGFQLNSNFIS